MHVHKLFKILVLGGAVAGAATGCASNRAKPTTSEAQPKAGEDGSDSAAPSSGKRSAQPSGGGGAMGW